MTRVLIIEASGNLWGSERALLDLLGALPTASVAVCCPPGRPLNAELERRGVRLLPYYIYDLHEKSRWARLRAVAGVLRACLAFRPDVIYLNQSGSYRISLPAATLLNLSIVAHVRIFEDAAYLASARPSARRLRGLIAISEAIERELREFVELRAVSLHRIYDAYVRAPAPPDPAPPGRSGRRIACVGRVVPVKGQDVLLRSLPILKKSYGDLECLIVGSGEDHFLAEVRRLDASYGADQVHWLGFVDDVVSLLRTCSVLVCPSYREPLGRVIFEAWDAGAVPVAFAGSGGAAEIIEAAAGGITYETQQPESLGRALRKALELTHEEAARLVDNGRSWMAKNCDAEQYGRAISAILTDAAKPLHRGP